MSESFIRRILSPVVTFRKGEAVGGLLMFVYSFLVMTAYNNIKPAAASQFIDDFGADNVPYVFLLAGLSMGFIMNYYSRLVGRVPRLWVLPGTQVILVGSLVGFWFLFQTGQPWVSAAFFFFGRLLLGIFLISQFWTLANDVYDPRQAKRVFGFIGGGASLGGMTGSAIVTFLTAYVGGTENLILVSAFVLAVCFFLIVEIQRRTKPSSETSGFQKQKETLGGGEALSMLRRSRHLQIIALIIGFGALGAATLEQQLYMAIEAEVQGKDAITSFLGQIQLIISLVGFFIQVYLTSRIYRLLGIGFALAVLPFSLGSTAIIILLNKALWASGLARVTDSALRYSLDKTTRETLFLPLPTEIKLKAKAFVDVTADRFIGKGIGSLVLLIAIKAMGATWYQLSFLSLTYCAFWLVLTRLAKSEYISSFRRSIETLELEPERLTSAAGDVATIETLVEELGSLDEQRVLRSIEMLEVLDKRNLITPLLLHHESSRVRARALTAIKGARHELIERWLPAVERRLKDDEPDVRAEAVAVLASARREDALGLMRAYIGDPDPRIAATAAVALAESTDEADRDAAEKTMERLASDAREAGISSRRQAARAISRTTDPRFRRLLIPLMYDPEIEVAREAVRSARQMGDPDFLFVPSFVSLLRHRRLRNEARDVLVSYGEGVVDTLDYFLTDENEDPWVRRHIPDTLALIPSAKSVEVLLRALESEDAFLHYKAVAALERLHRDHPDIPIDKETIDKAIVSDLKRYYRYLGVGYDLFEKGDIQEDSLVGQAVREKRERTMDRVYRLLGIVYERKDIHAARWTIDRGDARSRAAAIEYLDNTLAGNVRKYMLPILDDAPMEETVRKGNVFIKNRMRGEEETLARLMYDEDAVLAASAIDMVRERKLWSLADDLEQVVQFRDVKDFSVFEAASIALAAYRLRTDAPSAV